VLVRAKEDGLKEVIYKPFDIEELLERIDKLLSQDDQEK
jgi:DNA-binding response OmpR family regulator